MISKDPFSPLNRHDRFAFGLITALTGVVALSLAAFILIRGATSVGFVVALGVIACGVLALVLARRLFTKRTPYEEGYLVSPRLTFAVGVLFVVVAVTNVLTGSSEAAWLLAPGIAAIVFGWRQRRAKRSLESPSDGA